MINARNFEKYTVYNDNYTTTASNGTHYVQVGAPLTKEEIENHTKQQDRIKYEKDLKEFTMAAMQGFITCSKSGEDWNLGMIADWSIHMAVVQLDYIKKHFNNG